MADEEQVIYGLDKDIKERMDAKFSPERAAIAKEWIELILQEPLPALDHATLKDGIVLAKLINVLAPKTCKVQTSSMPFKQMENINGFLLGAEKLGCPKMELFQTIDLYENKNFNQVVDAIFSLSRHAHNKNPDIPLLGPRLAEKRTLSFSDEQLNAGKYIPRLQTGGTNATGVVVGSRAEYGQ
ncbi:calponin [Sorochytrium milnesiophthora]